MWHRGRQRSAYCTVILLISTNIYVTDAISPQIMYIELLPKYDIDFYLTYQFYATKGTIKHSVTLGSI